MNKNSFSGDSNIDKLKPSKDSRDYRHEQGELYSSIADRISPFSRLYMMGEYFSRESENDSNSIESKSTGTNFNLDLNFHRKSPERLLNSRVHEIANQCHLIDRIFLVTAMRKYMPGKVLRELLTVRESLGHQAKVT